MTFADFIHTLILLTILFAPLVGKFPKARTVRQLRDTRGRWAKEQEEIIWVIGPDRL